MVNEIDLVYVACHGIAGISETDLRWVIQELLAAIRDRQ
jgi:hypothetical protein